MDKVKGNKEITSGAAVFIPFVLSVIAAVTSPVIFAAAFVLMFALLMLPYYKNKKIWVLSVNFITCIPLNVFIFNAMHVFEKVPGLMKVRVPLFITAMLFLLTVEEVAGMIVAALLYREKKTVTGKK